MPLRNRPPPLPIGPGSWFEIFSPIPLRCLRAQPQEGMRFGSTARWSPWTAPLILLFVAVPLSQVPMHQGGGEGPAPFGSRSLPAHLRSISERIRHDVTIARKVSLAPRSLVVIDWGYNDSTLFSLWRSNGLFFVTRLKENPDYTVVEDPPIPRTRPIVSDQPMRSSRDSMPRDTAPIPFAGSCSRIGSRNSSCSPTTMR